VKHCLPCLLGLTFFLPTAGQAKSQSATLENAGSELSFRLSSGYLIEVEGRIGNQTKLKFILDTGASISIIDQKIAEKLNLKMGAGKSLNFDRELKWKTAIIRDVQLGPIRADNVAVLVGDLARYSEFAAKSDAVIGMDLLRLSNISIDFDSRKMIFDSSPRAYVAGSDPMVACLTVEIQVQNRPLHLIVDTGSPGILLYEQRLRDHVPGLRISGSVKSTTMGGRVPIRQTTLPQVVLGKRSREVPVIFLPSPPPGLPPNIDGVLGVSALQARRVHFDFMLKTISWE
jgi:predicted aspartyl protease